MISRALLLLILSCYSTFAVSFATTSLLLNPGGEANNLANWAKSAALRARDWITGRVTPACRCSFGDKRFAFLGGTWERRAAYRRSFPLLGIQGDDGVDRWRGLVGLRLVLWEPKGSTKDRRLTMRS